MNNQFQLGSVHRRFPLSCPRIEQGTARKSRDGNQPGGLKETTSIEKR
jgi:hypothetical protein